MPPPLEAVVRDRLAALAADVHALWADTSTPMRERKRITRLLIADVTLTRTTEITAQVRLSDPSAATTLRTYDHCLRHHLRNNSHGSSGTSRAP